MMYAPPPELQTEVFARVPKHLEITGRRSEWLDGRLHGAPTSFLEGPSFDRDGNLYCVDIPFGRIMRISPAGEFSVVLEYDGEPNGLKIHKDGRIFVADQKNGILVLDRASGTIKPLLTRANLERLKGPNDLFFASNGDLYFTDQGQSGWQDPSGRVLCLKADGTLNVVLSGIPSPNGLVMSPDESTLYLAVTRANAVWRIPMPKSGAVTKVGTFIQLSGGGGPDGMAIDEEGNLFVAHAGLGSVWAFSRFGEPVYRIKSCTDGRATTNLAFGGDDRRSLFITESATGTILTARLPTPGRVMYSHM
jgi:gluconolactonase